MTLEYKAYAKINWYLAITGRRNDGYHTLQMLNSRINLFDQMWLTKSNKLSLEIIGNEPLVADNNNLIIKAAKALSTYVNKPLPCQIRIDKKIPVGAGLGGGSANAATTLHALNRLYSLHLPLEALEKIGLTLGADVPFCLQSTPCKVEGIGEILEPISFAHDQYLIIIKPEQSLSTKKVFSRVNLKNLKPSNMNNAIEALKNNDLKRLSQTLRNDLQPLSQALCPEITKALADLTKSGAHFAQMSGSGSSVYGVYKSSERAKITYRDLQKRYNNVYLSTAFGGALPTWSKDLEEIRGD